MLDQWSVFDRPRGLALLWEPIMFAKLIMQTFLWYGVMGLVLFLAAGTLNWSGAWVFLGQMVAISILGGGWLARRDPGLVAERLGSPIQKGQPKADKILLSALLALIFVWLALMGLDAARFAWSSVPLWGRALGEFCLLLSVFVGFLTMRENSFAAPVVKVQKERGQRVISTGLYAQVRHPMYVGALLFFIGTPLLLGSCWGLAFALILIGMLCVRIPIEERALRDGLDGYDEYAARVRYRLVPGVW
jgi:protein-S-isoprenylcysteine O-methyltransferase Ste14